MSPHAVIADSTQESPSPDLSKFAVTNNAFLPEQSLPTILSDAYYEPWEIIAQHLPDLIQDNRIRDAITQLPILSTDRLKSEAEWRRAYVMLAYLTHAYVWGGDKPEEVRWLHDRNGFRAPS